MVYCFSGDINCADVLLAAKNSVFKNYPRDIFCDEKQ